MFTVHAVPQRLIYPSAFIAGNLGLEEPGPLAKTLKYAYQGIIRKRVGWPSLSYLLDGAVRFGRWCGVCGLCVWLAMRGGFRVAVSVYLLSWGVIRLSRIKHKIQTLQA